MNASKIITEEMTLQEKLDAIDKAMKAAQDLAKEQASNNSHAAPLDPASLTMCEGCQ